MRIPLSQPDLTDDDVDAVVRILRTPRLSLGPALETFERDVATYAGARHAVAVSSGTSGLHLCVRALGLSEGDEVITTPFSFVASANVMLYERAIPVFVDVDEQSLNMCPERIEDAITSRTRAILVVHTFGRPAAMAEIGKIAERRGLAVVEDACEAIGAEIGGARVGSIGAAGVFAFYPNKQMTTGEGGAIVTNDDAIASLARCLRNQGRDARQDWFEHVELGYNYRLSDINCALGSAQLVRLEEMLERRASVASRYAAQLAADGRLTLPSPIVPTGRMSWFVYVVLLDRRFGRVERDAIVAGMRDAGIQCGRYFAPIHLQPYYVHRFGHWRGAFPVAESAADRAIALPFFNRISDAEIDEVVGTLRGLLDDADGQGSAESS